MEGRSNNSSRPDAAAVNSAIDGRITINEILAVNVLTDKDESGAAAPWIELYNPTAQDVPLGVRRDRRSGPAAQGGRCRRG